MEISRNSGHDSGIGVIDEQHRELFRIVDRLRRRVQEKAGTDSVEALLGELVACSERHFALEEQLMSQFGYPDLPQHRSEHTSMLGSLHELKAQFHEGHQVLVALLPTFMEGWLRHHISDGDFGFVTFLKAHNLA
jgi:hemerythrin